MLFHLICFYSTWFCGRIDSINYLICLESSRLLGPQIFIYHFYNILMLLLLLLLCLFPGPLALSDYIAKTKRSTPNQRINDNFLFSFLMENKIFIFLRYKHDFFGSKPPNSSSGRNKKPQSSKTILLWPYPGPAFRLIPSTGRMDEKI